MLDKIIKSRLEKIKLLEKKKIFSYPANVVRTHSNRAVLDNFEQLIEKPVSLVGRIMAIREHGGSSFIDIFDGSAVIQVYLKRDNLGDKFDFFKKVIDLGDFISVSGIIFLTRKQEKTLEAKDWSIASKSLRPIPEKWYGLKDIEERYRKRYLDLLINNEVKERFLKRSLVIKKIREFLDNKDFLEVETPILQLIPGGTAARPFVTHHNALNKDFFLRIAPELYLKRLLVGGFEKVYELGRNFRNEGIDREHNPEFTMLELYASFKNYDYLMDLTEELFGFLIQSLYGQKNANIKYENKEINLKRPWRRISFVEALKKYVGIDYDKITVKEIKLKAEELNIKISPKIKNKAKIADELYKKFCRPLIINPVFITNHPLEISPLAKKDPEQSDKVLRFQLLIGGMEMVNAFSELNDPIDQKERFIVQEKERKSGDEEAHRLDKEYLEAMEYGMPPAAGLGLGIDRLVALLTDAKNLKEVILFPTLK